METAGHSASRISRPPDHSARAWSAVVLYRFDNERSKYDGFALRLGLQTFDGIKIMSKIKIKKSTLHRVNDIRIKS
jgi:hypothetical protein